MSPCWNNLRVRTVYEHTADNVELRDGANEVGDRVRLDGEHADIGRGVDRGREKSVNYSKRSFLFAH